MPAEANRLRRPVGSRDRRFFVALACAVVVGTPATILVARHGSTAVSSRCLETPHAGVMGGGTYRYCGAAIAPFCRQFGPSEQRIAAQCATFGVRVRPAGP